MRGATGDMSQAMMEKANSRLQVEKRNLNQTKSIQQHQVRASPFFRFSDEYEYVVRCVVCGLVLLPN